jgi:hypothetical protein
MRPSSSGLMDLLLPFVAAAFHWLLHRGTDCVCLGRLHDGEDSAQTWLQARRTTSLETSRSQLSGIIVHV